jgi:C1A family cysteine protease
MAPAEVRGHKIQRYGWIPDLPDQRDHLFAAAPPVLTSLPPSVDLRPDCPPVYDQGNLGSCTANAIGAGIQFDQMKEKQPDIFIPSRLFIYYNERVMEGTVDSDSGAMIRDGIKSVARLGACPEDDWPYDTPKFAEQPPQKSYDDAATEKVTSYARVVRDLGQMKGCLASGFPFVFGFAVYESFEGPDVAATGHAPMPGAGEQMIGGHAVLAVGYEDSNQWFIVRNSWGDGWGMQGYFTLPYPYFTQRSLSSDFWTIRVVE